MRRLTAMPRRNLEERARAGGFDLREFDGDIYWDESAFYAFTLEEIERDLEAPTTELAQMCSDLAAKIARDETTLRRLRVPETAWNLIAESLRRGDASLYGRFDFAYDGTGPAKMLEYNADTPTALFEAAVFQWQWLEDLKASGGLHDGADQFNSLHEKLIARLRAVVSGPRLHLTFAPESREDAGFIDYLADCATQAGLEPISIALKDVGLSTRGEFVDLQDRGITTLFKLYPWEFMFRDEFATGSAMHNLKFIEPPWKALLSNKGILPLLWAAAPGHPNLLPAYFEDDPQAASLGRSYARKPIYSREGADVELVKNGAVIARSEGPYGNEGFVRQAFVEPVSFAGRYPVVGSWVIGDEACGIGMREDGGPITSNRARFLPHAIV